MSRFLIWLTIICGVLLRFVDVSVPDLSTDEVQFALGASAAQPPGGMMMLRSAQLFFGNHIVVVRGVSILLGLLTLLVIFEIARFFCSKDKALYITALAAVFPSHILFSRLAYLSVPLSFAWAVLLLIFLETKREQNAVHLIALFAASVFATYVKTQGLLLPVFLLTGHVTLLLWKRTAVKHIARDPIVHILTLSLVPIAFYIATHPGIVATLMQYGGNTYGVSHFSHRLMILLSGWRTILPIFVILMPVSLIAIRKLPWPVLGIVTIGTIIGLILGGHHYYTTHLVFWAFPIGMLLFTVHPYVRDGTLVILLISSLLVAGPRAMVSPYPLFVKDGYWNMHSAAINEVLADTNEIIVLGNPGHHIRWYLEPRVLVGKTMNLEEQDGVFLMFLKEGSMWIDGDETLYEDEKVKIVRKTS